MVRDVEHREWLAGVLAAGGFSVAVLPEPSVDSPELRNAELVIADRESARVLGDSGPTRRILLAPRDGTVDLQEVKAGFNDVIAFPAEAEEIVARVRHALVS